MRHVGFSFITVSLSTYLSSVLGFTLLPHFHFSITTHNERGAWGPCWLVMVPRNKVRNGQQRKQPSYDDDDDDGYCT